MKVLEIAPVKFEDEKMLILDQTKLPGEEVYIEMKTKEDVCFHSCILYQKK